MRKFIICLVFLLLLAVALGVPVVRAYQQYIQAQTTVLTEKRDYYAQEMREYAGFVLSTQRASGAYAMHPPQDGNSINPYFACYSAIGLMASANADVAESVRRYLDWHFDHLNAFDYNGLDGTICDYTIQKDALGIEQEISTDTYDSTDSYAALFLWALADYVALTGDTAYATIHLDDIVRVVDVILATQSDGASFAKPDYQVYYLMDNSEVYAGLMRADALLKTLINTAPLGVARRVAAVQSKVATLLTVMKPRMDELFWNPDGQYYWASRSKGADGTFIPTNQPPSAFYPDAVAQLFPLAMYGKKADMQRAGMLYATFCATFSWQELSHMLSNDVSHYWGMLAYCAAQLGDETRLTTYLDAVKRSWHTDATPLYNADAAWIARACAHMRDTYQEKLESLSPRTFVSDYVRNLWS